MIVKIAWRNIWRSPTRSSVVLISIILGIWAGVFIMSFSYGLNNQRVAEAINSTLTHVQIHNPEFEKDGKVEFAIADVKGIASVLDTMKVVKAYSERTIFNGMIASANAARGVKILGVDPEKENNISTIPSNVTQGTWFAEEKKNPLIIGERLAEILKIKVGNKVVITFQDAENNLTSASFRVSGLYRTNNSKMDELLIYMHKTDLQSYLGGNYIHEIAITAHVLTQADLLKENLQGEFPNESVKSWKEISPVLGYADEMMAFSLMLIMSIIMLALLFGIVNNMLMAILERKRELGMLQAIGMNKPKVFVMIVIETMFIGFVGGPIGMLLGWLTVLYFGSVGIDLSIVGDGMASFGMATKIHPELDANYYLLITVMVFFMALVASIYPAVKALRLNPVEAIRSI